MVKHNNVINNNHFRKDWQRRVKTFFDQPAKKKKRYLRRKAKAARVAPRPSGLLRPAVRCPSQRYNMKVRVGRGFTAGELKEAGFSAKNARTFGIAVDKRRKDRSEETFRMNVNRLKQYKSKLVVITKKNRATQERENCVSGKLDMPITNPKPVIKEMSLAAFDKVNDQVGAYATVRYARHNARMVGPRYRKAKEEEAKKK